MPRSFHGSNRSHSSGSSRHGNSRSGRDGDSDSNSYTDKRHQRGDSRVGNEENDGKQCETPISSVLIEDSSVLIND